jgi:hypothetical protein
VREPWYPHAFWPSYFRSRTRDRYLQMDAARRRQWRDLKAAMPCIDATRTASILNARLPRDAYRLKMLRHLAMHDAPGTLLIKWFDENCTEDFPCY